METESVNFAVIALVFAASLISVVVANEWPIVAYRLRNRFTPRSRVPSHPLTYTNLAEFRKHEGRAPWDA